MKKFASVLLCVLLSVVAIAQSANLMSLARAELDKRGLTESEVRARLLENGIDVDHISPTEYPNYQDRVLAILDQMQAERAEAVAASTSADSGAISNDNVVITANEIPVTTVGEAAAEKALAEAIEESEKHPERSRDIYGHSLFIDKSMDVFRTTDGAQAPDTYILGDGDEVHISIFGSSQTEIHQRIAPDGSIQPAGSTKIFLKGLSLAQGRQVIKNKLAQHYSFRQDQIAVTITTARTITVSIYGEVEVQGGFTLSALNTAFNALAAAGGPSHIGSVRNIQRSRGGKTERLDLYQYMIGNAAGTFYDLQNNDVLFVPVAEKIVSISGAVNRPMRYEMVSGETLADLIRYAGGITADAYPEFIQVERYEFGEKILLEFSLSEILSGGKKVGLENGDIVRIKEINKPMENYVNINGDVYYGGRYDFNKNQSLTVLLENAKPRYTARTEYVLVERTRPDETVEILTVPFPGINGNPDFTLQARDVVHVLEQADFRDIATISVSGQVRDPFTRNFGIYDRMSISQAIELAGGLKPSVYPVAYIFRKDLTNSDKMEYIPVLLDKDGEKLLQPGDELRIYDNSTFSNIGELRISGAVKNPVGISFDPAVTVHDLITMAGGFEVGASYERVELFRMNISKKDEVKFDMITLAVDENYQLTNGDFQLQPYDHLVVRLTPNFTKGRTVELNGRVRYPGVYVIEDNRTQLSDVLKMAGGLLDDAEPSARLFRSYKGRGTIGINLDQVRSHKGDNRYDPILMDDDVINIVREENTIVIRETGTRMAQYVPDDLSASQKNVIYKGRHSAKWYIKHNAGGFAKYADRNSVTVTKPNGESESTKRFLWMRFYPKVEPGSVITLRMDQERREKAEKPKEKVDWERVAANSLSSLTSIVSMILLIERLN
jgi:protein involved in polysaccharide export with SLBB domain